MMNLDWHTVFMKDLDWSFAGEIILRTLVMFSLILVVLRLSGKKGVRQLSIFEVAIIIGLGSAAGDPMFNSEIPIVPALIVFVTILLFYRAITWFSVKNEKFESLVEGDPAYVIEDGLFVLKDRSNQTFATDEFFAEMRQQNIEHLGQVRTAILETNGTISFFYYNDEELKPGMPVLPKVYAKKSANIPYNGDYACTYCGNVETVKAGTHKCSRCKKEVWVAAIKTKRLT